MFTPVYTNVTNHIHVWLWKPTQLLSAGRFSVVCHDQRSHGFFQAVQSTAIVKNGDREIWCLDCSERNAQQWAKRFQSEKKSTNPFPQTGKRTGGNLWDDLARVFYIFKSLAANTTSLPNLPQGFLFQKHIFATEIPCILLLISCLNPPRILDSINLVDPKQRRHARLVSASSVRMQMKPMNWML